MKKIVCIMVLTFVIMGAAFAQAKPATPAPAPAKPATPATPAAPAAVPQEKKNAIALDLFQLFKGFIATDSDSDFSVFIFSAAYERLIVPHFSVGGDAETYFITLGSISLFYLGIAAEGRYYPVTNFDKFFIGTTFGFNFLAGSVDINSDDGIGIHGFAGLTTSLKVGYKLIFPNNNIYVEPSMAYVLSKSSSYFPTPFGWNGGLRFGYMF
ncbi:hypothetical protein [Treponema sp. R6D11]